MVLDDLALTLQTAGVGTVGTDIFTGYLPDPVADPVIVLHEYGGRATAYTLGGPEIEYPRVQVRVRSRVYQTARQKAHDISTALAGLANVQLGGPAGAFYLAIRPLQTPFLLGRDANDRIEFAFNLEAEVRAP